MGRGGHEDRLAAEIADALPPKGWTPRLHTLDEWLAGAARTRETYPDRDDMLACFATRPDLTRADFMLGMYEDGIDLETAKEGWFATAIFLQRKLNGQA